MDCSPPGSFVHGVLQTELLEWVAVPFSRGSSRPRGQTLVSCVSCTASGLFTHSISWEAWGLWQRLMDKDLDASVWRRDINGG